MDSIICIFSSYIGIAIFTIGICFCFLAKTFRYGVFCTLVANLFFIVSIVFPKHIMMYIGLESLSIIFSNVDTELIKIKAVIVGVIICGIIWSLKWLKQLLMYGCICMFFPKILKPNQKSIDNTK